MNPYRTLCDHTYHNQLEFPPRPDPHHQRNLLRKSRYQVLVMAPSEARKAEASRQRQPLALQELLTAPLPLVNQI